MKITEEELVAFADGELDDSAAKEIEAALQGDENLVGKLRDYKKSASILKKEFSSMRQEIPKDLAAQVDAWERDAKKVNEGVGGSWLIEWFSNFQFQYALPAVATFALGVLIGPALFAPDANINIEPSVDYSEPQISLRGRLLSQSGLFDVDNTLESILNVQIIQGGESILSGGTILAASPFSLTLLSPINGTASISEIINGNDFEVLDTQESQSGRFITFATMAVEEQANLLLRIEIENSGMLIQHTVQFAVQEEE